ncbi:MAG: GAF domain-containing protein [Acidobacteria bacterium]|nr:GAF domain-containing protein [Acidobacteriota bacterium]
MLLYNTTGRRSTRGLTIASQGANEKPLLDEASFQQLLAAAYVLQEHNSSLASKAPTLEPTAVHSEIADIQSLVRAGLDITSAAELITDRLRKITGATGVSLSLVSDGYLDCVAEAGEPARIPGSSVASHSLVATERLRNGELFESSDAGTDIRLSADLCRRVGVGCLVASPIHEFGQIAGVLEVRWGRAHAFQERHLRACHLMADLASGTLERKGRVAEREPAASRNSAPPSNPSPVASAPAPGTQSHVPSKPVPKRDEDAQKPLRSSAPVTDSPVERCRVCGRPFGPRESFCGNCSLPRAASSSSGGLQSKWAALWYMHQARTKSAAGTPPSKSAGNGGSTGLTRATSRETQPPVTKPAPPRPATPVASPPVVIPPKRELAKPTPNPVHTTREAIRPTTDFRENREPRPRVTPLARLEAHEHTPAVNASRRTLHRRNAVLIGVAVVLASFLALWAGTAAPEDSDLPWYDSLLVELGVTKPPHRPLMAGNPDTRVWLDVHTRVYYCPGSDLYGKTAGGRFTRQRGAQHDHFLPASGFVCP